LAGDDDAPVRERRGTTPLAAPTRDRSSLAVTGLPVRFYWAWAVLPKAPRWWPDQCRCIDSTTCTVRRRSDGPLMGCRSSERRHRGPWRRLRAGL